MRRFIISCHRWLGLGSSVLLSVIGLSGAAFLVPAPPYVRPLLDELHVTLMIPGAGKWIVLAASAAAVFLELSGLYLWWRRKSWTIRWRSGWRLAANDLHHVVGAILLALMLLLAVTALGRIALRPFVPPSSIVLKANSALHTGLRFPAPVKVVYAIGGFGFLVQGVTGVLMWWPVRGRSGADTRLRLHA